MTDWLTNRHVWKPEANYLILFILLWNTDKTVEEFISIIAAKHFICQNTLFIIIVASEENLLDAFRLYWREYNYG